MDIKDEVYKILSSDNSGHGINHINNVISLSNELSMNISCNKDIVYLIALLHDVDDYKLVGINNSNEFSNAKKLLNQYITDKDIINKVLTGIKEIGYSKRLEGIMPSSIEAMIVSDSDMLDAMGANGIIRSIEYNTSKHRQIFNKDLYPTINMNSLEYKNKNDSTMINHVFEKLLKLKEMMLTDKGRELAIERDKFMISFLYQYFKELNLNDWIKYLDEYIEKR